MFWTQREREREMQRKRLKMQRCLNRRQPPKDHFTNSTRKYRMAKQMLNVSKIDKASLKSVVQSGIKSVIVVQ